MYITTDFRWYHYMLDWYKACTKYNANPDWCWAKNNASFHQHFGWPMLSCEQPTARMELGRFVVRRFVANLLLVWMGLKVKWGLTSRFKNQILFLHAITYSNSKTNAWNVDGYQDCILVQPVFIISIYLIKAEF